MPGRSYASPVTVVGVVVRALLLVVGATSIGFAFNWLRPGGVEFGQVEAVAVCEAESVVVPELDPATAATQCADVETVILDVRSRARYMDGHVAGATHLPCNADPIGDDTSGLLARANLILVYGDSTEEARPVAQAIAQRHLTVQILAGGYPAWEAAGLGCASGPCDCTGSHL